MPALARKFILPPGGGSVWVHAIQRCVRRAYLCGVDERGVNRDYRRDWVENRLRLLSGIFACEVASYAVMSNHLHVVLRMCPDVAAQWSDTEVAERWLRLFPGRGVERLPDGSVAEPDPTVVAVFAGNSAWIAERRKRLVELSWFMRTVAEPIARRANKEDDCNAVKLRESITTPIVRVDSYSLA